MTVDVGNTSAKLTVMEGPDSVVSVTVPEVTQGAVTGMLQDTGAEGVISCSVGPDISGILAAVCASRDLPYVSLDADTPVPVEVDYDRAGLGADRLAAAVGVAEPDRCWLIAGAGTALTRLHSPGHEHALREPAQPHAPPSVGVARRLRATVRTRHRAGNTLGSDTGHGLRNHVGARSVQAVLSRGSAVRHRRRRPRTEPATHHNECAAHRVS